MVNKELLKEIEDYCKLNSLDFHIEIDKMLKNAFTTFKYGSSPRTVKKKKKVLEPVKIKKKVVTKPKIKKEVIEKEVLPTNNGKLDMYGE